MSRAFNPTTSVIIFDPGNLDTLHTGAWTYLALFKCDDATFDSQFILCLDGAVGGVIRNIIWVNSSGEIQMTVGGFTRSFGFTISDDVWYLLVVKKAAGTATPRANIFNYTAGTWAGWANGSDTLDNDNTPIVEVQLGNGPGSFPLDGSVAAVAAYDVVLADGVAEGLTTAALDWFDLGPVMMIRLNQASTAIPVTDDTGGGFDQSSIVGTSVDPDDPPGFDYDLATASTERWGLVI